MTCALARLRARDSRNLAHIFSYISVLTESRNSRVNFECNPLKQGVSVKEFVESVTFDFRKVVVVVCAHNSGYCGAACKCAKGCGREIRHRELPQGSRSVKYLNSEEEPGRNLLEELLIQHQKYHFSPKYSTFPQSYCSPTSVLCSLLLCFYIKSSSGVLQMEGAEFIH